MSNGARSYLEAEDAAAGTPPPPTVDETLVSHALNAVARVMDWDEARPLDPSELQTEDLSIIVRGKGQPLYTFRGQLRQDASAAYDALDAALAPHDLYALFRTRRNDATSSAPHRIHIIRGRLPEQGPPRVWLPLLLFVLTFASVLYTGTSIAIGEISLSDPRAARDIAENLLPNLWRGLPYALAIFLILGPHEMGHFLMMRRYRTPASLPHFIPAFFLSPFGTFGAVIAMRGPLKNRRALLDVGIAGPLAGLVMAVPILLIGLATSPVVPITGGLVEGNSLLYAGAKILVFGRFLPDGQVDVLLNQFAWAGWTGLFVTALNLIPLGQLDGGHLLYSLLGERVRRLYYPMMAAFVLLPLFVSTLWAVFWLLLLFVGGFYAVPLDAITPLETRRRRLALGTLLLFLLIFPPVPLSGMGVGGGLLASPLASAGLLLTSVLIVLRQRWR